MESRPTETLHFMTPFCWPQGTSKKKVFTTRRVLLVVSDGEDNHSKYKLKEVLAALQESKVILYTIGLFSSDSSFMYGGGGGKKPLKQLAEVTGGVSFFP